jgi:pimeloyl-ACP methyl ester carboxylesterase
MAIKTNKDREMGHTITIEGQRIYYRSFGSGTPLVLLHGYAATGLLWQKCLPFLAQQHQVIAIDIPGHGQSKLTGPWHLSDMAPLLALLLQQMDLMPAAVIGHSMGGAIAIHLSTLAPDMIERLVLVDSTGMPLEAGIPTLAARSVRSALTPQGGNSYPLSVQLGMLKLDPYLYWQVAQEMVKSDFRNELASLNLPTLIIWGEQDVLLPVELGERLSKALPHAQFMRIPDAGHRLPLSHPELFSRIVLEFLQEGRRD